MKNFFIFKRREIIIIKLIINNSVKTIYIKIAFTKYLNKKYNINNKK